MVRRSGTEADGIEADGTEADGTEADGGEADSVRSAESAACGAACVSAAPACPPRQRFRRAKPSQPAARSTRFRPLFLATYRAASA